MKILGANHLFSFFNPWRHTWVIQISNAFICTVEICLGLQVMTTFICKDQLLRLACLNIASVTSNKLECNHSNPRHATWDGESWLFFHREHWHWLSEKSTTQYALILCVANKNYGLLTMQPFLCIRGNVVICRVVWRSWNSVVCNHPLRTLSQNCPPVQMRSLHNLPKHHCHPPSLHAALLPRKLARTAVSSLSTDDARLSRWQFFLYRDLQSAE